MWDILVAYEPILKGLHETTSVAQASSPCSEGHSLLCVQTVIIERDKMQWEG
jgi:hypothetical protein